MTHWGPNRQSVHRLLVRTTTKRSVAFYARSLGRAIAWIHHARRYHPTRRHHWIEYEDESADLRRAPPAPAHRIIVRTPGKRDVSFYAQTVMGAIRWILRARLRHLDRRRHWIEYEDQPADRRRVHPDERTSMTYQASQRVPMMTLLLLLLVLVAPVHAALAIDTIAFGENGAFVNTVTTSAFSTAGSNELLLALIGTDDQAAGQAVMSVATMGLTWTFVRRTNTQRGDSEVWRAWTTIQLFGITVRATLTQVAASAITVVALTGADAIMPIGAIASGSGLNSAAATSLTTTRAGSLVFGAGSDWSASAFPTPALGQTILHSFTAAGLTTVWAQQTTQSVATSGSLVRLADTAPTTATYNLTAVEVLASISAPPPSTTTIVNLAWNASASPVTGYRVYVGTMSATYGQPFEAGSALTFAVPSRVIGTRYYYAVTAVDTGGESIFSNEVTGIVGTGLPLVPTGIQVIR